MVGCNGGDANYLCTSSIDNADQVRGVSKYPSGDPDAINFYDDPPGANQFRYIFHGAVRRVGTTQGLPGVTIRLFSGGAGTLLNEVVSGVNGEFTIESNAMPSEEVTSVFLYRLNAVTPDGFTASSVQAINCNGGGDNLWCTANSVDKETIELQVKNLNVPDAIYFYRAPPVDMALSPTSGSSCPSQTQLFVATYTKKPPGSITSLTPICSLTPATGWPTRCTCSGGAG